MPEEKSRDEEKLNQIIKAIDGISNRIDAMEQRLDKIDKTGQVSNPVFSNLPRPAAHIMEAMRAKEGKDRKNFTGGSGSRKAEAISIVKPNENKNLESEIGLKWLGRIGILALIFGVSFFLKYAFENDWVGEAGRVAMGIISGLALIVLGDYFRKKYAEYSQTLTGGGIGILYLSVYAGFAYYYLIGQVSAFAAMCIITFFGAFLAINYESVILAALAIIGGFLTPALVSTGANNQLILFIYLTLLNLGILAISFYRNWRVLNIIGLAATVCVFLGWYARYYSVSQLFLTEIFLALWFVIYAIATLSHNILNKNLANKTDTVLMALNALNYFGLSYFLLVHSYGDFMGFFAVMMAVFYFGLAYASHNLNSEDKYLTLFLPALSIFFLTIAAPIQFDGNLVTIVWGIEAVVLFWMGFNLNNFTLRRYAWIIFALVFFRLIFIDSAVVSLEEYTVILNWRFAAFIIGTVSAFVIYHLYSSSKLALRPEEVKGKAIMMFVANLLLLWVLSSEVSTYFDKQSYVDYQRYSPVCNRGSYEPGRGYVQDYYCEKKFQEYEAKMAQSVVAKKAANNSKNMVLTILWAAYAITLLVVGIAKKNSLLRHMGIGLFGVVIVKLFLYDLWSLGQQYRIVSSLTLGAILLLASFAYNKYKEKIKEII